MDTKTKINWYSGITAAIFTGIGGALQLGYLSPKYGGIALLASSVLQAFQKRVVTEVSNPQTPVEQAQLDQAVSAGIKIKGQ